MSLIKVFLFTRLCESTVYLLYLLRPSSGILLNYFNFLDKDFDNLGMYVIICDYVHNTGDFASHFCRYFSCSFYGDGNLLSTAYALNKKDAKTKAAAEALKHLLFRDSVSKKYRCLLMLFNSFLL